MNLLFEVGWQGVKWQGTTLARRGSLPGYAINFGYGSFNNDLFHRSLQIHFRSSKILLALINPRNTYDRADCLSGTDSETGGGWYHRYGDGIPAASKIRMWTQDLYNSALKRYTSYTVKKKNKKNCRCSLKFPHISLDEERVIEMDVLQLRNLKKYFFKKKNSNRYDCIQYNFVATKV